MKGDEDFENSLAQEKDRMTVLILKTGNLLYCYPFTQSEGLNNNIYTVDTTYPI